MNLTKDLFTKTIHEAEKPVLVEYQAPWCVYCKRLESVMQAVEKQYADTLTIGFVNIDDEPALEEQENIELIPTLALYRDGKRLGTIVNPDSKAKIDTFIRETLNNKE